MPRCYAIQWVHWEYSGPPTPAEVAALHLLTAMVNGVRAYGRYYGFATEQERAEWIAENPRDRRPVESDDPRLQIALQSDDENLALRLIGSRRHSKHFHVKEM